ncbi:hypothetical protein CPHO_11490 [Corynebacterium phocae]|uniref:Uncharacterized protein n=1 Tax=Corynebacterium phocae TaxID=161895 RepID=A0A1L7D5R0_9CORY|nr:hypothetical protein [Corynebacterium phocae]APT93407.1 hypothetical protein CPHO_11490 [Corynebacterium phocae]KAA8721101.1 hypothetical protein F4V58_10965 [Corynebacterium phocae]
MKRSLISATTAVALASTALAAPSAGAVTMNIHGNTCNFTFSQEEKSVGGVYTWVSKKPKDLAKSDHAALKSNREVHDWGDPAKQQVVDELLASFEACTQGRNYDKSNPFTELENPKNASAIALSLIGIITVLGLVAMFNGPQIRDFAANNLGIRL